MAPPFDEARIDKARAVLDSARGLVATHVDDAYKPLEILLRRYQGLPVRPNAMSILGQEAAERSHQLVLAWILDPRESHGLGDTFLRRFLARTGDPIALARAAAEGTLEARIVCEVGLPAGRLDLLVICTDLLLSIEIKVFSEEHPLEVDGRDMLQSEAYAAQLRDPKIQDDIIARYSAKRFVAHRPHVLGVLVRRRADVEPDSEGASDQSSHGQGATIVDWLEIDHALATCLSRVEVPVVAQHLLLAFRTTLLETSAAESPPLATIERVRSFIDMPLLRRRHPMEALRVATQFRRLGDHRNG